MRALLISAAMLPLALAACERPTPVDDNTAVQPAPSHTGENVDECPRADGQPCK